MMGGKAANIADINHINLKSSGITRITCNSKPDSPSAIVLLCS